MKLKDTDDRRILLDSPIYIRVNDRLQRNGNQIRSIYFLGHSILLVTDYDSIQASIAKPIHVWRVSSSEDLEP